jgi:hypothetical protein
MLKRVLSLVAVLAFVALAYVLLRGEFASTPDATPTRPEALNVEPREVFSPPEPIDDSSTKAPRPTPIEAVAPKTVDLPTLAASDPRVRERLKPFGLPSDWMAQDNLVRRLAVLVDSATRGEWPRRPLRVLKLEGRFNVIERDGRLYADPRNARRFDAKLDLLESIEPSAAARFLEAIDPLLDAAMRNLGRPVDGRDAILEAIDWILAIPDVASAGDHELVQPKVFYEYADEQLETLPPLEKQLLRLGPQNLKRLKAYLGRLRDEIGGSRS